MGTIRIEEGSLKVKSEIIEGEEWKSEGVEE
jgi:hypothetical protein